MPNYLVSGSIYIESTGTEADYEFEMFHDVPPDPLTILEYMIQTGEIQIIPSHWEEVDEDGVGV